MDATNQRNLAAIDQDLAEAFRIVERFCRNQPKLWNKVGENVWSVGVAAIPIVRDLHELRGNVFRYAEAMKDYLAMLGYLTVVRRQLEDAESR